MLKIDPAKNNNTPSSNLGTAKSGSGNDGFGRAAGDSETENFDSTDFATVMENLAKKEKTTSKESQSPQPEREATNKNRENKLNQHRENETISKDEKQPAKTEDVTAASASAASNLQTNEVSIDSEVTMLPARSILHIADLERIVSSIRTNNFEGNQQVVISLKNSVLEGLQIKLTADEKGRIVAEFLAANEKIKTQVAARSDELADVLRQRGIELSAVKTSVDSGASQHNSQNKFAAEASELQSATTPRISPETTEEIEDISSNDLNSKAVYRA